MTATLTPQQKLEKLRRLKHLLRYSWNCGRPDCDGRPHVGCPVKHARAKQLPPPGDWSGWMLMSGRGLGKTRSGGEWIKERMLSEANHRAALIVPDFATGRDVCVEGESGLHGINPGDGVIPPEYIKSWNRSIGELTLTNSSRLKIFSTHTQYDAELLRGYQCHSAWFEEAATQRFGALAFSMLEFALRLGDDPRFVITTTPRPTKHIRALVDDPDIVVVTGSTFENADNLPAAQLRRLKRRYEGTTLGRQELLGELLNASDGALFAHTMFVHENYAPAMTRVVVAVDPAGTATSTSDETGIMVVGLAEDGSCWVLADKSGVYSPEEWGRVVMAAYDEHEADCVVGETNYGGDLVAANMRAAARLAGRSVLPFRKVTASRGKARRAEPVVTLYESGRVKHLGVLSELEDQMTTWVPPGRFNAEGDPIEPSDDSPDRLDAVVWGVTELALKPGKTRDRARFPLEAA